MNGPPHPWEGSAWCAGVTRGGLPCGNREIEGLGWCLHHVPDELLDEAEEIRGARRCTHRSGCRGYAKEGTVPPRCKTHGANLGSKQSMQAAARVVEGRIAARLAEIMWLAAARRAGRQ